MRRGIGWLSAVLGLLALGLALVGSRGRSLAAEPPEPVGLPSSGQAAVRPAAGGGERSLHVHPNELLAQVATIAAAGTAWVRIEFQMEPDGSLDLAGYSAVVDSLEDHGLAAIGLVDYMSLPEDLDGDGQRDYDDPDDYVAYQQRFTETLRTLATYFQGRIDHWEIWNEENGGTWHVPAEYYARLLVKSAAVLQAIDADNQVLFGGLDHAWATSQYLEPVYDALDDEWDGARPFDILAVHPYFRIIGGVPVLDPKIYLWDGGDPPRTILDPYLKLMSERGDGDVDIWITELGWNSALDNPAIEACPGLKVVCVDRTTQALYLHDGLDVLLGKVEDLQGNRNRVKTIVWYQYHDTTSSAAALAAKMGLDRDRIATDPQAICPADWGLVDASRQPKPAYWAYQTYTRPVTDVMVVGPTASPEPAAVLLAWETKTGIGLGGFVLYRAEKPGSAGEPGGAEVRLTADPIPPQSPGGAEYRYLDTAVALSTTYSYTLVAVIDGSPAQRYGPVAAMPVAPPPSPPFLATNDGPVVLGTLVTLTATLTSSAGVTFTQATAITFTWSFGDGQGGEGAVVTHTYPATGVYTALVTATARPSGTFTTTLAPTTTAPAELTATTRVTVTRPPSWIYLPLVMRGR